jgi:hypothetical protein
MREGFYEYEFGGSWTNAIIFIRKFLISSGSSIFGENEYYIFLFFHDRRCKKKYVVGQIEDSLDRYFSKFEPQVYTVLCCLDILRRHVVDHQWQSKTDILGID